MKTKFLLLTASMQLLLLLGSCNRENLSKNINPPRNIKCGNATVLKSHCGYLFIPDGTEPCLIADSASVKTHFGVSIHSGQRLTILYEPAPGVLCDCIMICDGHSVSCCPGVTIKEITVCP